MKAMHTSTARVFDDALALPVEQRLALVDALLGSLNSPIDPQIERVWADEAERRVAQIDSGEATLVDGEEAFSRLRAKYQQ
jgi:putative addiction module component (TIGR02574 family)